MKLKFWLVRVGWIAYIKSEPQLQKSAEKLMPTQRLCSIEFGEKARFIIESPEALLQMMNIIERKL